MYEDEIISRRLCPDTGWTLIRTLHYEASEGPLWVRARRIWRTRYYDSWLFSLKLLWLELWIAPIPPKEIESAYSADGVYIDTTNSALIEVLKRHGVCPQVGTNGDVCTIGFSETEQRWYGWSQRSHTSFAVGDRVTSSDHLCATSGWTEDYLAAHPELDKRLPVGFVAETLDDAKLMAIAYAEAVG